MLRRFLTPPCRLRCMSQSRPLKEPTTMNRACTGLVRPTLVDCTSAASSAPRRSWFASAADGRVCSRECGRICSNPRPLSRSFLQFHNLALWLGRRHHFPSSLALELSPSQRSALGQLGFPQRLSIVDFVSRQLSLGIHIIVATLQLDLIWSAHRLRRRLTSSSVVSIFLRRPSH